MPGVNICWSQHWICTDCTTQFKENLFLISLSLIISLGKPLNPKLCAGLRAWYERPRWCRAPWIMSEGMHPRSPASLPCPERGTRKTAQWLWLPSQELRREKVIALCVDVSWDLRWGGCTVNPSHSMEGVSLRHEGKYVPRGICGKGQARFLNLRLLLAQLPTPAPHPHPPPMLYALAKCCSLKNLRAATTTHGLSSIRGQK